jgi:hypothetical protein
MSYSPSYGSLTIYFEVVFRESPEAHTLIGMQWLTKPLSGETPFSETVVLLHTISILQRASLACKHNVPP